MRHLLEQETLCTAYGSNIGHCGTDNIGGTTQKMIAFMSGCLMTSRSGVG